MSNEQRHAVCLALLQRSANGKLKKYTTKEVASLFSVPMRTVQRIWKLSKKNMRDGVTDVSHSKTKNCGRKRIVVDWDKFENLPLTQRIVQQFETRSYKATLKSNEAKSNGR